MAIPTGTLTDRVAVITGSGTGIGAGIADALAMAGASVVISYRSNATGAEALARRLRDRGTPVLVRPCDVQSYDAVQALFDETMTRFGRVDIMVNNSGITEPHSILDMTPDDWDKTLNINLRGMFFCTQRAAREMIASARGGKVINLSSVHGFGAVPNHSHYEASKGGINLYTKACAIELASHNIQVNAIAPGAIEVDRYFSFPGYSREAWGKWIPAGRVGLPDDIGPLAAFLAGPGADYITGQIIWVDGGMTSRLAGLNN